MRVAHVTKRTLTLPTPSVELGIMDHARNARILNKKLVAGRDSEFWASPDAACRFNVILQVVPLLIINI